MKMYLKIGTFLMVAWFAVSCQEEASTAYVSPDVLTKSSELTLKLQRVAMANAADNNTLDSATCFKIQLPVETTINGQFLIVDSEQDYQQVADMLSVPSDDQDPIEFGYPITLVYDNGNQVTVTNASQMQQLQLECPTDSSMLPILCVDLVFPFSIALYDPVTQTPQNIQINDSFELLDFLVGLSPAQFYQINYPIMATNFDGFNVDILNNAALLAYINEVGDNCNNCGNENILTDDLIMYIPFANQIVDLTGFSSPLPADQQYTFVTDRSGHANGAFSFDTGEATNIIQLNVNSNNNLLQSGGFSISFWFNRQDPQVFDFEQLYTNNGLQIGLGNPLNQEKRSPFLLASGMTSAIYDAQWVENATMLGELNVWHHLAIVYNDDSIYLFRDGQLQGVSASANFTSSMMGGGVFGNNFKGYIDDIRMYKRALTQNEIEVLHDLEGDVNTCMN